MSNREKEFEENQLKQERIFMTAILALVQADVNAQTANASALAAIAADIKTLLSAPAVAADPEVVAKLTQIQADLGDTAAAVTAAATSTTATAVAAAAAQPETITPPSPSA